MGKNQKLQKVKGNSSKHLQHAAAKPSLTSADLAVKVTAAKGTSMNSRPLVSGKNIMECSIEHEDSSSSSECHSESDSVSKSLGEDDTSDSSPDACENASDSAGISVVPEIAPNANSMEEENDGKRKATFASLFAGNRTASNGSSLLQFDVEDGPLHILDSDVNDDHNECNYCLVGYFAGRFPGKAALQQLVTSWKTKVSVHFHSSGWIMFKFNGEEDRMQILQGGPYMVYGRALILKNMPKFFKFDNEELTKFPVWVQFRNLPLELWSNMALSKLCSKLGKPVYSDKLTSCRARISFARALVEIDVNKEIVNHIDLILPNGEVMTQDVVYENLPKFCSHCKKVGHSLAACRIVERNSEKIKNYDKTKGQKDIDANAPVDSSARGEDAIETPLLQPVNVDGFQVLNRSEVDVPSNDVQIIVGQPAKNRINHLDARSAGKGSSSKDTAPPTAAKLSQDAGLPMTAGFHHSTSKLKDAIVQPDIVPSIADHWQVDKHCSRHKNKKKDRKGNTALPSALLGGNSSKLC